MNMSTLRLLINFAYSQFMVFDEAVNNPGCAWTEAHSAQGFARRDSVVSFGTLLEYGRANITISQDSYQPRGEYVRVFAVPFLVTSGKVMVCGPEEANDPSKRIDIPPGNYRLVAAQRLTGDENDEQSFDLFFESIMIPLTRSAILIADDALDPPTPLLETVGISGED
jgi:hypothetical protein